MENNDVIIGCDKDGVINNFILEYVFTYNKLADDRTDYLDYKWKPEKYYFLDNPIINPKINKKVEKRFPKIMKSSKLYPGAKKFLIDLHNLFPNMIIITFQKSDQSKLATLQWMKKNELPYSCVFANGNDKWRYCDILIDDNIENLEMMKNRNKEGICLAREWNRNYDGLRFNSYDEIINYLQ